LYGDEGEVPESDEFLIPIGKAEIKRPGTDISLIAHGRSVIMALRAAKELKEQHNVDAEVIDLRSIRPLDEAAILKSVKKTNRALLIDENKPFCGVGAQISHMIQRKAFDYLDGPVHRISAVDAPAIYSPPLERLQLPDAALIVQEVRDMLRIKA
jgi:pyruvate dehydrogenase E1 component beta subunit